MAVPAEKSDAPVTDQEHQQAVDSVKKFKEAKQYDKAKHWAHYMCHRCQSGSLHVKAAYWAYELKQFAILEGKKEDQDMWDKWLVDMQPFIEKAKKEVAKPAAAAPVPAPVVQPAPAAVPAPTPVPYQVQAVQPQPQTGQPNAYTAWQAQQPTVQPSGRPEQYYPNQYNTPLQPQAQQDYSYQQYQPQPQFPPQVQPAYQPQVQPAAQAPSYQPQRRQAGYGQQQQQQQYQPQQPFQEQPQPQPQQHSTYKSSSDTYQPEEYAPAPAPAPSANQAQWGQYDEPSYYEESWEQPRDKRYPERRDTHDSRDRRGFEDSRERDYDIRSRKGKKGEKGEKGEKGTKKGAKGEKGGKKVDKGGKKGKRDVRDAVEGMLKNVQEDIDKGGNRKKKAEMWIKAIKGIVLSYLEGVSGAVAEADSTPDPFQTNKISYTANPRNADEVKSFYQRQDQDWHEGTGQPAPGRRNHHLVQGSEAQGILNELKLGFQCAENYNFIPEGLVYSPGFLNQEEQYQLLCDIDTRSDGWSEEFSRRTQQYGYKFEYTRDHVSKADEDIPAWGNVLIGKLKNSGYIKGPAPNQLIVNEYYPGQGIGTHKDKHCFEEEVVSISLLSPYTINWTNVSDRIATQFGVPIRSCILMNLESGSVTAFRGQARFKWQHGIAPCDKDLDCNGQPYNRGRRVSVTLRYVDPVKFNRRQELIEAGKIDEQDDHQSRARMLRQQEEGGTSYRAEVQKDHGKGRGRGAGIGALPIAQPASKGRGRRAGEDDRPMVRGRGLAAESGNYVPQATGKGRGRGAMPTPPSPPPLGKSMDHGPPPPYSAPPAAEDDDENYVPI